MSRSHALPLFHVAAQHCFLMPSLYVGTSNIVLDAPDPATVAGHGRAVHRSRNCSVRRRCWIGLLRHPDFDQCRPVVAAEGVLRRVDHAGRGHRELEGPPAADGVC